MSEGWGMRVKKNNQFDQIILAHDLTFIGFNDFLNMFFSIFNPIVNKDLVGVKLGWMLDYEARWWGGGDQRWAQVGPAELYCKFSCSEEIIFA